MKKFLTSFIFIFSLVQAGQSQEAFQELCTIDHSCFETNDPKKAFEEFLEAHKPPKDLQDYINNNRIKMSSRIKTKNKTFLVKEGIDRVLNAHRLKKMIKKFNLNLLTVPQKYISNIKGRYYVFSELIERKKEEIEKSNFQEYTKQLQFLTDNTGYDDFYIGNFIFYENEKNIILIALIDTENRSFNLFKNQLMINLQEKNLMVNISSEKKSALKINVLSSMFHIGNYITTREDQKYFDAILKKENSQ